MLERITWVDCYHLQVEWFGRLWCCWTFFLLLLLFSLWTYISFFNHIVIKQHGINQCLWRSLCIWKQIYIFITTFNIVVVGGACFGQVLFDVLVLLNGNYVFILFSLWMISMQLHSLVACLRLLTETGLIIFYVKSLSLKIYQYLPNIWAHDMWGCATQCQRFWHKALKKKLKMHFVSISQLFIFTYNILSIQQYEKVLFSRKYCMGSLRIMCWSSIQLIVMSFILCFVQFMQL